MTRRAEGIVIFFSASNRPSVTIGGAVTEKAANNARHFPFARTAPMPGAMGFSEVGRERVHGHEREFVGRVRSPMLACVGDHTDVRIGNSLCALGGCDRTHKLQLANCVRLIRPMLATPPPQRGSGLSSCAPKRAHCNQNLGALAGRWSQRFDGFPAKPHPRRKNGSGESYWELGCPGTIGRRSTTSPNLP
jgi:hypothetical protein